MYLSSTTCWPVRGPHLLLFNVYRKFFPQRVNRRENEVYNSPSSNAGVKTEWICTHTLCEKNVQLYIRLWKKKVTRKIFRINEKKESAKYLWFIDDT